MRKKRNIPAIVIGLSIPAMWLLVLIEYGIINAVTSEPTIPKVKERMPWDKGDPLSVDKEWRDKQKEKEEDSGTDC